MLTCKLTIHVSPHDTCNTVHTAQCFLRLERLVTRRWPSPSMTSFRNCNNVVITLYKHIHDIYIYKICIPINPTERPCYVIKTKHHHKGQNKLQISTCIPIMSLTPIACRILTKLGFLAVGRASSRMGVPISNTFSCVILVDEHYIRKCIGHVLKGYH